MRRARRAADMARQNIALAVNQAGVIEARIQTGSVVFMDLMLLEKSAC